MRVRLPVLPVTNFADLSIKAAVVGHFLYFDGGEVLLLPDSQGNTANAPGN